MEGMKGMFGGGMRGAAEIYTYHAPLAIGVLLREVQWYSEDVDVGKGASQFAAPIFKVGPICENM